MLSLPVALLAATLAADTREVAITIDDLPMAQSGPAACAPAELTRLTKQLLAPLAKEHLPVTGFVVGNNCPGLTPAERQGALRQWLDAGAELGNHTFSHPGYGQTSIADYLDNIRRAEPGIREVIGQRPLRYFRSPMLHTGPTVEKKKALAEFLASNGYRQAMVTFDNSEWMFAFVYSQALQRGDTAMADRARREYLPYLESTIAFFEQRTLEVVGRPMRHILLIHANRLNAEAMPDLLAMLRRRGYRIVSLEHALEDPAYAQPETYAGPQGISWLHRWARTKGLPDKWEPDEPAWLREAYEKWR